MFCPGRTNGVGVGAGDKRRGKGRKGGRERSEVQRAEGCVVCLVRVLVHLPLWNRLDDLKGDKEKAGYKLDVTKTLTLDC